MPQRRSRCIDAQNPQARRARARQAAQQYDTDYFDAGPVISERTKELRSRIMTAWKLYFRDILHIDPDSIWSDLCLGSEQAKAHCRSFLRDYVQSSSYTALSLESAESEVKRSVNSVDAVVCYWKSLYAEADNTVLSDQRRKDVQNAHKWRTCNEQSDHRHGGLAREITNWIHLGLSKEVQLRTQSSYPKSEATADDIIVVLNTTWFCANDLPMTPFMRISFHGIVLSAGLGGFRSGTILTFLRDPANPTEKKLVITPTIHKNKLKAGQAATKLTALSFGVTPIPYSVVCLSSLITARAIADDAFSPSFDSVETLFARPDLENADFIQLHWKEEMLDRPIFEMSKSHFYRCWHQTWQVAGIREKRRFYATRVGAGARLDGVLSNALRNHILSNTTSTFEKSYVAKQVRQDLTKLAFGSRTGQNDSSLFEFLRGMSVNRDPGAPIEPSLEDLQALETREDVQAARAARAASIGTTEYSKANRILNTLIETLSKLTVEKRRTEYFQTVDRLRGQGLPTTHLARTSGLSESSKKRKNNQRHNSALRVAQYLQNLDAQVKEKDTIEQNPKLYMQLLVEYQLGNSGEHIPLAQTSELAVETKPTCHLQRDKPRCLLGCGWFADRRCLSQHYLSRHVRNGQFDRPFPCPVCRLEHGNDITIKSMQAWCSHVERIHGKIHVPSPPQPLKRCLLCQESFRVLALHTRKYHDQTERKFNSPFPCPECYRKGKEVMIDGYTAWNVHLVDDHASLEDPSSDPVEIGSANNFVIKKRKRDGIGVWNGPEAKTHASTDDASSCHVEVDMVNSADSKKRRREGIPIAAEDTLFLDLPTDINGPASLDLSTNLDLSTDLESATDSDIPTDLEFTTELDTSIGLDFPIDHDLTTDFNLSTDLDFPINLDPHLLTMQFSDSAPWQDATCQEPWVGESLLMCLST